MKGEKRKKLDAAGWSVGSADDFLGLSADETQQVEAALDSSAVTEGLCIPEGWTIETLDRLPDHALLSTPSPRRYMVTIDFKRRGLRTGCSVSGKFIGEEWNMRRKKYGGRGWKQALVDDAVTHLQGIL